MREGQLSLIWVYTAIIQNLKIESKQIKNDKNK